MGIYISGVSEFKCPWQRPSSLKRHLSLRCCSKLLAHARLFSLHSRLEPTAHSSALLKRCLSLRCRSGRSSWWWPSPSLARSGSSSGTTAGTRLDLAFRRPFAAFCDLSLTYSLPFAAFHWPLPDLSLVLRCLALPFNWPFAALSLPFRCHSLTAGPL